MAIKEKTISGIKWTTIATVNNAIIQLLKLFILARLLEKSDFGIIAIAFMVVGFIDIFANFGLAVGLIHKQDITQKQYSSIFWLNLILSIIFYLLLCVATPFISKFYNNSIFNTVIPLLATQLIISAFGKMFYTFKTKELEFKFISIVNISSVLLGAIATIILALLDFGVYSFVWGQLLQVLISQSVFLIAGLKKYKILFYCKLKDVLDLLKIGGYQVATQVLDYFSAKIDILLIGRFFGLEILGIYNLAKELVLKIISAINPIISNVATPAFAKIQNNIPLMQKRYLDVIRFLTSINFPIFILLCVFAEPITILLYEQKNIAVAFFLQVLSIWGLIQSISNPAGILMVSLGRTDLGLKWTIVRIIFTSLSIFIACYISIEAVAYSQVIVAFLFLFLYWYMMIYKMIKLSLKEYLMACSKALLFSLLSVIIVLPFLLFAKQLSINYQYIGIILYVFAYFTLNLLLNKEYVVEILSSAFPSFKKRFNNYENNK